MAGKEKYLKNQSLAEHTESIEKDNNLFSGSAGNQKCFNSAISVNSSEAGERQKINSVNSASSVRDIMLFIR
jgi:hypothetical protein